MIDVGKDLQSAYDYGYRQGVKDTLDDIHKTLERSLREKFTRLIKDEPNNSEKPNNCEACEHWNDTEDGCADRHGCKTEPQTCDNCKLKDTTKWCNNQVVCRAYKPKTEPTGYNLSPVEDETQTVKCFSCTHSKKPNTVEPCKSCEDFNNYEPQTDCDDRYALKTDSGEVVAYACPLGCEQTDCPWK